MKRTLSAIRIEDLCALLPRSTISGLMALEGPLLRRLANHGPGRFFVSHVSHGGLGRLGAGLARTARLLEGRSPVELALFVLWYFFEPFMEEVRVSDEEAVFFLNRCPYGWRTGEDAPLCDAVMQLERELVAGMGGTLIIEETIPEGAPKCRFTLRTDAAPDPDRL